MTAALSWIFDPNTLSSMPVRFEESADGSVARVVSHHRPHLGVVLVTALLPASFVAICVAVLLLSSGLSSQVRFLLIGAAAFALVLGIGMIILLLVSTSEHAKKAAWIEFDRSSGTIRVPRQFLEFLARTDGPLGIVEINGWTRPSQNARQSRTRLFQIQIGPIESDNLGRVPLITRTSNGSSTEGAFQSFAAAAGLPYEVITISPDAAPAMRDIGGLRSDSN